MTFSPWVLRGVFIAIFVVALLGLVVSRVLGRPYIGAVVAIVASCLFVLLWLGSKG